MGTPAKVVGVREDLVQRFEHGSMAGKRRAQGHTGRALLIA